MMKGKALPSEEHKHAMSLSTTYVEDTGASRPVATFRRRKTKGIPALHWTTVHSPFGNRDRRGKKSFSTTARPAAAATYYNRGSRIKFLPAGLFDPTFKKDQLESDERKSDLQRRRRLRHSTDPSVALRERVAQISLAPYTHHSQSTEDLPNVNRGQYSASQHSWKREASLSELLLAGPTFREIIAEEVKTQRGIHLWRSPFSPQEDSEIQKKLKLRDLDLAAQAHFVVQVGLREQEKIEALRPNQQQKLAPRIVHRQAEAECSGSKKEATAALREGKSFAPGSAHPASGEALEGKEKLNTLSVTPIAEMSIPGYRANLTNLTAQPTNAPQTLSGWKIVTTSMFPYHDQSLTEPDAPVSMISSFHEKTGTRTLGRKSLGLLNDTIDRVNELHQRVGAAFLPEAIKKGLPTMLGGSPAKDQLWLEAVVMELAEALRSGPTDGTEEGKTYLLSFLQKQRGLPLRKKGVLVLLKRIRHRLCKAAKCASTCLSTGVPLTPGEPSIRCFKASQNCWRCVTQPYADLGANHPQSNASANEPSIRLQPPISGADISGALLNSGAEDFQPKQAISRLEVPNNHVQENSEHPSSCRPPTVDSSEISKDVLHRKAAPPQSADDCIRERMHITEHTKVFKQRTSDSSGCLVQVQKGECHASTTLQNAESSPLVSNSRNPLAALGSMLGGKHEVIRAESPLHPAPLKYFPSVEETVEQAASTDADKGLSRGELQCSRVILSSATEKTIVAFRESRRKFHLMNEPLLQEESLQHALIQFKEQCGGRICFENEQTGIWMLHDAIVEQLLDREMKQLVSCIDSVTRMFVDRLFETESIRMAMLVRPACQERIGSVTEAC